MTVEIRRSSARFVERESGRMTAHAFSFGSAYDPDWLSFGPMVCHDDHLLGPGRGFDEHPHSGLEIVTWVLEGTVRHTDSLGGATSLAAGECGLLSAGSGVTHTEHASDEGRARFVQVWLRADDPDAEPHHTSHAVTGLGPGTGLVPVAGPDGPMRVGVAGASYWVGRLGPNETVTLPAAPRLHVYVAGGALLRSSLAEPLHAGDAFLMTGEPEHDVTAGVPTELLVWALPQ